MFLHVPVILFTGGMRGRGTCMSRGVGGHTWQGDMHGGGHTWRRGMHGRGQGTGGHEWQADDHCSGRYASYWNAFLYVQNFEHGAKWRVVTCPPWNRQTESQIDMTDNITFQQSSYRKETSVNIRRLSNGMPDSYLTDITLWRMIPTDYL